MAGENIGSVLSSEIIVSGADILRDPGGQAGVKSQLVWEDIRWGLQPEEIGEMVVSGIRDNAAYIHTQDWSETFADRFQRVLKDFEGKGSKRPRRLEQE